ncbi:hypothetical protein ACFLRO_00450 [Bacteroidota bacterium]
MRRDMRIYHDLDLDQIIAVEESLLRFRRGRWDRQIEYGISADERHFFFVDRELKRIMIGLDGFVLPLKSYWSVPHQIVFHWLLGLTRGEREKLGTIKPRHLRKLSRVTSTHLDLFCGGSQSDIRSFRDVHLGVEEDVEVMRPSIAWTILHHPVAVLPSHAVDLELDLFAEMQRRYPDYELDLIYGVVGENTHVRTDKRGQLRAFETVLPSYGFDTNKVVIGEDAGRNFEPIYLWMARESYRNTDFTALTGINFGYDNGRSGYRFGFGVHLDEHNLTLTQPIRLGRRFDGVTDLKSGSVSTFRRWVHHTDQRDIEDLVTHFLTEDIQQVFEEIRAIIDDAKSNQFRDPEVSERVLTHTESRRFRDYQDLLLSNLDDFSSSYGHTNYTHFLCWLKLAKQIRHDGRTANMAEFVAACVLSGRR